MANVYFLFLTSLIFLRKCSDAAKFLKCTTEFCDEYVQKFPCPPLDPACSNPNISLVLPSPTVCNCCEHCFLFKEIGEDCVVGHPGQPLPTVICKPGTECVKGICKKMNGPDPDFHPGYECQNGKCHCAVIEKNELKPIFGEFKETEEIKKEKQCECSISAHFAQKSINGLLPFPNVYIPIARCLSNGQFDPLQCIDNLCGCVNKATGEWDTLIRKVPIAALGPNNPKCFDEKRHKVGEYYTTCERERNSLMSDKFWGDVEKIDILFSHKVECTPDGNYAPLATQI